MASDPASPAGSHELRTRIISAAILVPIALLALIAGGYAFTAFVVVMGLIAFWEWCGITAPIESPWPRGTWFGMGLVYVIVPCTGFILLRRAEPAGWAAILFILLVVWATDIAAFFGGRAIGGPKLWPRISPKKTWSGALCGLAAAVAAGGLCAAVTRVGEVGAGLVLAVPLTIAAQIGDLFESAVKRRFGVKDSGAIIPGHGGVLDRVDGLFAAVALAWLIAALGLGGRILTLPTYSAAAVGAVT